MRLNDPPVTSFAYNGKNYEIDLAFDNVLDVFDQLEDKALMEYGKAEICLALLLDVKVEEYEVISLWNHIYEEFIHIKSKQIIEYDRKGNPLPVQKEQKQSIDFDKDGEFIYASFMQAYQIDLFKSQGSLHWSQFKSLLNGLPSNTIMQRIIQIRLWEPSKDDSSEYKQSMKELQEVYALEEEEVDE